MEVKFKGLPKASENILRAMSSLGFRIPSIYHLATSGASLLLWSTVLVTFRERPKLGDGPRRWYSFQLQHCMNVLIT